MRYGCLFEERSQVIQILKKCRVKYISLLKELEGCVEMGIRILISDFGPPWTPARSLRLGERGPSVKRSNADKDLEGELGTLGPPKTGLGQGLRSAECGQPNGDSEKPIRQIKNQKSKIENPGKAYLSARKAYYAQEEKFNKQVKDVIEQYRTAFSGLFVKCKTEFPSIGNFQFSIRNPQSAIRNPLSSIYFLVQKGAVDPFRKAFRHIHSNGSARLLLSGPWPPYNFVQPEYNDRNKSMIEGIEF